MKTDRGAWPLADGDVAPVRASFQNTLERLPPSLRDAGHRLVGSLLTPNWALEWSLPRWLGVAFGLPPEQILALVQSNVFGLAYVRLRDDLLDGEAPADGSWPLLAAALYEPWLEHYGRLFDGHSPFWGYFAEFMAQWLQAVDAGRQPQAVDVRAGGEANLRTLARRGAPLKICCAGACLLAGREQELAELLGAIDALLAGAVLLDHAVDWPADLQAGRPNAFAIYVSPHSLVSLAQDRAQRAVLEGIYLTAAPASYFALLHRQLKTARAQAETVGCPELVRFIGWLDGQAAAFGAGLIDTAGALLRAVTLQIVG